MEKEKILVALPITEEQKNRLEDIVQGDEIHYCLAADVTREQVQEANVIIGNVPVEYLKDSENLRWIQLNNAGTEGFCVPGALPEGVILTNATGAYGMAISEHMIAMLFMLQKRLDTYLFQQKEHCWKKQQHMYVVDGSTTLVLGLGDIGTTFARKMKAMGSYIIGVRKTKQPKPDYVDEQYTMDELHKLLPRADVVAMSLPGYAETYHVIGKEELSLMKKTAVLLNVGRGTAVDTDALCEALKQEQIFGAGLDVTSPEPLPKEHPIWDAPHTIITPHVSGGYALPETLMKIWELSLKNLKKYKSGEELDNRIDFSTGYVGRKRK